MKEQRQPAFDGEGLIPGERLKRLVQKFLEETGLVRASRFDEEKMAVLAAKTSFPLGVYYAAIERGMNHAVTTGALVTAFGWFGPHVASCEKEFLRRRSDPATAPRPKRRMQGRAGCEDCDGRGWMRDPHISYAARICPCTGEEVHGVVLLSRIEGALEYLKQKEMEAMEARLKK